MKIGGINIIIELKDVKKSFKEKLVLDFDNFIVQENDYISIVGESGAGKTTLLSILALFDTVTQGTYYFKGRKIDHKKEDIEKLRMNNIGFVFQSYNLLQYLNVEENILLPTIYQKKSNINYKEKCIEIARKLKIDDLLQKTVSNLSGGEKQRVAIARALILSPKIIIADEPTGNLDDKNSEIVLDIFKKISKDTTIIVVTHNTDVALTAKTRYLIANTKLIKLS